MAWLLKPKLHIYKHVIKRTLHTSEGRHLRSAWVDVDFGTLLAFLSIATLLDDLFALPVFAEDMITFGLGCFLPCFGRCFDTFASGFQTDLVDLGAVPPKVPF